MGKFENDANIQYTTFNNYEYKGTSKSLSVKDTHQALSSTNKNTQVENLDLDFENQSNSKATILNENNVPELNSSNRLNTNQSNNNQNINSTEQSTYNNNQTVTKNSSSNEQIASSPAQKTTSNTLETKDKGTTSMGATTTGAAPNSEVSSSNVNSINHNQSTSMKSQKTNGKSMKENGENKDSLGEQNQKTTLDFIKYVNEAKYKINNSETDIEQIDPSTLTEEDLQQLIGTMTEDQYDEFTSNVKAFYNNQIEYIENLLNGTDKQEGIKALLEEYEQVYNFLFSPDNEIARVNNRIDESIDYYLKYTNKLEELGINAEAFASINREEQIQMLKEKDEGIKLELESLNELLENQKKVLAQTFPEENFENYNEFKQMYDLLKYQVSTQEENLNLYKNLVESVEYDYLYYLQEFDKYSFKTEFTEEEIKKFEEDARIDNSNRNSILGGGIDTFSWKEYSKKHPDITPLEFMFMAKEASSIKFATYNNVPNYEELSVILQVQDKFPQFAKTYNYLYEIDPKKAEDFLNKCEYELNNIEGQLEAEKFLSTLDIDDGEGDKLGVIANELGVSVQGLTDGLEGFCSGLYYSLEAVGTALGICEENRALSASEYKKMYILQALLPQEAKEKAGLITKTEDGKYTNTDSNSLIDYTKKYSGGLLNNNYEISQGIGNMLPSIALGTFCPIAGSVSLGISAGGNSYHNAMVEGHSVFSSIMYGLFTGSTEAITERFLGALPGLSDVQITSFKTYLQAMLKEGGQEAVQGTIDILYQTAFMGEELPTTVEGWKELAQDIGKQGIYGAITAGILNSPSLIGTHIPGNKLETKENQQIENLKAEEVKEENKEYINEQAKKLEEKVDSEKTTFEEIKYSDYTSEQLNFRSLNGQEALEEITRVGAIFEIKDLTNQQVKELLKSNDIAVKELTISQALELLDSNVITREQLSGDQALEFITKNSSEYTIHDLTYNQISELSKNGRITAKETLEYIKFGLKGGRLTKKNINEMFTELVGKNLSSWIPTANQAYRIYTKLLKACSHANIEMSQLTKGLKIMEIVEDYYIEASDLNNQLQTGKKIFSTYRTHGIIHIFDVLTQSINSVDAMKKAGIEGIDVDTVMLSAIMHDTGMAGGQQLVLSVGEDGKIKISTQEAQKDGATYRESHSFNSGVKIIENHQQLSKAGYTNEQIAEAALLAFAHSKSNSGLNPLSANQAGWSFAIQALDAARTYAKIDFDFLGALKSAGIIVSTDLTGGTSSENLEVKCPKTYKVDENGNIVKVEGKPDKGVTDGKGGKVEGKIDMYEFGDAVINNLSYEALTVRIGDALTNNDNAITNQYLGDINFETTDYSKQYTTEQVLEKIIAAGVVENTTTKDNIIEALLDKKDALQNAAFAETKHTDESDSVTFEVNGKKLNDSQPFVLGENNQTYDIETKENEIDIIVNIKDSNAVPFSTIFAIEERAGELTSKGEDILTIGSDGKILKLVIKLDETTKPEIRELYNQYKEAYSDNRTIEVVVE